MILYDQDFNPHNDAQAEDRAHRVGQTRPVKVYRLVTRHTIEEQMYKCAQRKLELDAKMQEREEEALAEREEDLERENMQRKRKTPSKKMALLFTEYVY